MFWVSWCSSWWVGHDHPLLVLTLLPQHTTLILSTIIMTSWHHDIANMSQSHHKVNMSDRNLENFNIQLWKEPPLELFPKTDSDLTLLLSRCEVCKFDEDSGELWPTTTSGSGRTREEEIRGQTSEKTLSPFPVSSPVFASDLSISRSKIGIETFLATVFLGGALASPSAGWLGGLAVTMSAWELT